MPKKTYTQINSITLAVAGSSVTFGSIPQNFRDLRIVIAGTASTPANTTFRFNGDTGNNYIALVMSGNGSSPFSGTYAATSFMRFGALYTSLGNVVGDIMDYSATDKHKTALGRSSTAGNEVAAFAGRWANTSAITSVAVLTSTGTFATGTTFTLYGIEA